MPMSAEGFSGEAPQQSQGVVLQPAFCSAQILGAELIQGKMLIPYEKWHSYRSAEDFDKTLTAECSSIHPSAFAGQNRNQILQGGK